MPTAKLNQFLSELVAATPPPVRGGRQPKILFATQADVEPPRFILFTTGFLEETYRRFIERRLREAFGFDGSPIVISMGSASAAAPRPSSAASGTEPGGPGGAARGRARPGAAPAGRRPATGRPPRRGAAAGGR